MKTYQVRTEKIPGICLFMKENYDVLIEVTAIIHSHCDIAAVPNDSRYTKEKITEVMDILVAGANI